MAAAAPDQTATPASPPKVKPGVVKIVGLVVLSLLLGFGYNREASRSYGPERVAGFGLGMLHGALMPAALPTLMMGKDVPIYARNNVGRGYNIGFILGLNLCGTVFFGFAFWQPKSGRRPGEME